MIGITHRQTSKKIARSDKKTADVVVHKTITKPTTAKCDLPKYLDFLLCEPKSATCTRLSELSDMSHDNVNRFLLREDFGPKDLFLEAVTRLILEGGTLSVDDTVLDNTL